ncbi:MAG: cobalt transporter CbiM [Deltaproteobacteria bacterium]|nr:cobalt transporter CbiM [Deltaproteobacteria bacterium]
MHIPDGYLGPQTYTTLYAAMLPVWYLASKKVKETFKARQIPMLALAAAFTFIIMMFNIPAPGGTSGHMVGSAVAAIILGPWAAVIAVSIALVIQALIFGDGGITAIGANCFNMAFIMPFSAYYIYKFICGNSSLTSKRGFIAAAVSGYISLNLASLATAFELGLQPIIASTADGKPLYAPYPLSITIPVMAIEHLFLFGPIEAIGTALVVSYIYKMDEQILYSSKKDTSLKPLWLILILLIMLTPLGLLAQGTAWGEWGGDELKVMLGFVPDGIKKLENIWTAVLPDYNIAGWESPVKTGIGYIISAGVGSSIIVMLVYLAGRLFTNKEGRD